MAICNDCQDMESRDINLHIGMSLHRVVMCDKQVHYPLSFITCCADRAKDYAENFCWTTFGIVYDVAEIWDQWDINHGEAGSTWYSDNHIDCVMVDGMEIKIGAQS